MCISAIFAAVVFRPDPVPNGLIQQSVGRSLRARERRARLPFPPYRRPPARLGRDEHAERDEPGFANGVVSGISDFLSQLDCETYAVIFSDGLYVNACLSSLKIAALATLIALIAGYPIAYGMARSRRHGATRKTREDKCAAGS